MEILWLILCGRVMRLWACLCMYRQEKAGKRQDGIHCLCQQIASSLTLPSSGYKELSLMHQPPCSLPCWLMCPGPSYQQVEREGGGVVVFMSRETHPCRAPPRPGTPVHFNPSLTFDFVTFSGHFGRALLTMPRSQHLRALQDLGVKGLDLHVKPLTPWCMVFFEEFTLTQLFKELHAFMWLEASSTSRQKPAIGHL